MDAEWGPSQRLSDVFAHPWNMTLGAIQDESLVREISKRIAEQNKALGIHFNFSPSVDVNNNSKIIVGSDCCYEAVCRKHYLE